MKRIVLINIVITIVLMVAIEFTTRVVSWISGNGLTLSLHEIGPFDPRINQIATIGGSTTANDNLNYEENWPGCGIRSEKLAIRNDWLKRAAKSKG